MPLCRDSVGRASEKTTGTVTRTRTALPSTLVGAYSHWRAAAIAASSSPGTLLMTVVDSTLPWASTTMSRITIPRIPWASASWG